MQPVGIVVHALSGKDIRRLVAHGATTTNREKINSVKRMISAMDALHVDEIQIIPDSSGIGTQVIAELGPHLRHSRLSLMALAPVRGNQQDTIDAAALMSAQNFACAIVLGGDGTCRAAAKAIGTVPMVPVSTGTNNVFPQHSEGTLVGMAAAYIANGTVDARHCATRRPLLRLARDGQPVDIALVDLVTVTAQTSAARAVWDTRVVEELFLTHASPTSIGLSSIGGWVDPMETGQNHALHVELGEPAEALIEVLAPIAPGVLQPVHVRSHRRISSGESMQLNALPCTICLDGEREIYADDASTWTVSYELAGPMTIDVNAVLFEAQKSAV